MCVYEYIYIYIKTDQHQINENKFENKESRSNLRHSCLILFWPAHPPNRLPARTCSELLWSLPPFSILVCAGLLWSALVCSGLLWSALVCPGLPWSALVLSSGLHWSALVCFGLP